MIRGGLARTAASRAVTVVAVMLPLLVCAAGARSAAAARDAGRDRGHGAGITVVVGCLDPAPGQHHRRCGVLIVVCGRAGRTVTSVALLRSVLGAGGVVVRVGAACPARPPTTPPATAPPPPTSAPPTSVPPPASPPTSTGTAEPTGPGMPATSPPTAGTPAPGPPGAGAGAPPGAAVGPRTPSPHAAGYLSPPPEPGPAAPTAPRSRPPGRSATPPFAAVAPVSAPPGDGQGGAATRWWLLTVLCVILPAALAAAFPRGPGRHT